MALLLAMSTPGQRYVSPIPGPPHWGFATLCWDTVNQRPLLVTDEVPNRVRTFDGTSWPVVATAPFSARQQLAAVFDERRGRLLLSSGFDPAAATFPTELWSWDGSVWRIESNAAPPGYWWPVRDPLRDLLVLVQMHWNSCLIFAWDGAGWRQMPGAGCPNTPQHSAPYFDLRVGAICAWQMRSGLMANQFVLGDGGWNLVQRLNAHPGYFERERVVVKTNGDAVLIARPLAFANWDGASIRGEQHQYMRTVVHPISACIDPARDRLYLWDQFGPYVADPVPAAGGQNLPAGCPGLGAPILQTHWLPVVGRVWWLQATGTGIPGSGVMLAIGFSSTSFGGVALPMELSMVGAPGCWLRTDIDFMLAARVLTSTEAFWDLPIPPLQSMYGLEVFAQALVPVPYRNPAGVLLTNAVVGLLGM